MARLDSLFRFSFYLCLVLSTTSLAFAAWGQLADTLYFYIPMSFLVALAWWLNDRWTLSVRASNVLAIAIAVAWPLWLFVTLRSNRLQSEEVEVELVRLALPFFAPLISTLLLAKLFRPKSIRDYWTIYLLGLVQMVLACVLAMTNKLDRDAPLFPLAVLAYLLALIWTLRNFTLYSLFLAPAGRRRGAAAAATFSASTQRARLGLVSSLAWFVLTAVVGLAIFFLIPRGATTLTTSTFGDTGQAAQTGFKPSVDLSGEGRLQVSEELVFRATVRNHVDAPATLQRLPRWRGVSCADYASGRWRPFRKDLMVHQTSNHPQQNFDDLRISYELDIRKVRQGGAVSTDEVPNRVIGEIPLFTLETYVIDSVRNGRATPLVFLDPNSPFTDHRTVSVGVSRQEGCVSAQLMEHRPVRNVFYQQVIAQADIGRTEWKQTVTPDLEQGMAEYVQKLRSLPPRLRDSRRLRNLADEYLRAEKVPENASVAVKAKALERHLDIGGGFAYSLDRRRVDTGLDPNEDFLLNVKAGSCERYASALALLLRSIGIPARLVIGFRGADWNSVGQFYEVREFHSHAWVEAAVAVDQREELRDDGTKVSKVSSVAWLSLDPTPELDSQSRNQSMWLQNLSFARMLWEFFILDFSGDLQRQRFFNELNRLGWSRLQSLLERFGTVGLVLLLATFVLSVALAVLLLRILQRNWRRYKAWRKEYAWLPVVPFYRRLLYVMMGRWKMKPVETQTAAEFASSAANRLAASPTGRGFTDLPAEVADRYYAVRFGSEAAAPAEAELTPRLAELARIKP